MIESNTVEAIRLLTFEGARLPNPECDILLNAAEYLYDPIGYKLYRSKHPEYRPEFDNDNPEFSWR